MNHEWYEGLPAPVRANWEILTQAAATAHPNSPMPDGMDFETLKGTFLQVAAAKGLASLQMKGEGVAEVSINAAGHPLMPHFAALGTGRVVGWPDAVRTLSALAAVPPGAAPSTSAARLVAETDTDIPSEEVLRQVGEELRRLHPLVRAGKYVFGAVGTPVTGFIWLPPGARPPPLPPHRVAFVRNPAGEILIYLPLRPLHLVLTIAMIDQQLVSQVPLGEQIMLVPLPAEVPAWGVLEEISDGRCSDTGALILLMNRLLCAPRSLGN